MLRFNFPCARPPGALCSLVAAALAIAATLVVPAAAAPALPAPPARSVQDGVVFDGVPPNNALPVADLQRYQGASATRFLDWLSDGSLLAAKRQDGRDRLLRLTAPEPDTASGLGPDTGPPPAGALNSAATQPFRSDWLASLQDEPDGNGAGLYLAPLGGGVSRRLIDPAAHPGPPVWAHDGRRLAFTAALGEGTTADLYVLDTADAAAPRRIAAGGASAWQVLAWTSADQSLLVRHAVCAAGDELLLVDVATGALRRVDAPEESTPGYAHIAAARLGEDGRGIYLLTDRNSDHLQLRYIDLYDASVHGLSPPLSHDIEHFDVSADGRYFAYSWSENGYGRVAVVDRKAALQYTPPALPSGSVTALRFDRAGSRLAIGLAPAVAPPDVYVYTLETRTTARWTHSELGPLDPAALVAPQTLRFPTWDRVDGRARTLTALLHRARGAGPHPVLVVIDDADARAVLNLFTQYCVDELGLTVLTPALRRGEQGALDFGALLTWIGTQADLQRDRVLVLGRGTGGTLGLTVLGLYGDRVRAAIDIDGAAGSAQLAPVRRPVLLIRGLETPPLDAASTEQLLWRLRNANVDSWLVAPRDAQGSLTGTAARAVSEQVMARFLASRLGG